MDLLLVACQRAEEEKTVKIGRTAELDSEVEKNKVFTIGTILLNNAFSKRDDTDSDDNWLDEEDDWEDEDINNEKNLLGPKTIWIDSGSTI